jgi:catalase
MVLDRKITNHHNENEQVAFGTGVLVDGLDFSDDKMLVGRTFSYSDTQRYRVGPNYLQLPVNRSSARPATNQRGGQMEYSVDLGEEGQSPHTLRAEHAGRPTGGGLPDPRRARARSSRGA